MDKEKNILEGVCTFHSETGTEGGYWAFQDKKFMGIPDNTEICGKCHYFRDYVENKNTSALLQVVSTQPLDEALKGIKPKLCNREDHEWILVYPRGISSYDGLHILDDDDKLTIFDKEKPEEVVWEGLIFLRKYPPFKESAYGMWIHADQKGMNREKWARWFLDSYPAKLVKEKPIHEVVSELKKMFGIRLTAVIAGTRDGRAIDRWILEERKPLLERRERLRGALEITELLKDREDVQTIRAWFMGMNPDLDDQAPALMLSENIEAVKSAARNFLAYG